MAFSLQEMFKGILRLKNEDAASMQIGYQEVEILHAASGNATPSTIENCRCISSDTAGIVRIDFVNHLGVTTKECLYLNAGVLRSVRNVSKLYQYYTGTTVGTAKCYNQDGAQLTNAIKLHR